ncbi:MAG: hypothetical protein MJE77_19500 [Proteobacteria bacterium]|nr:hypothetical protein [Pseudomonadota bacterium]
MTNKYYSVGYYFKNKENPRVLVATYDEQRASSNPDDPHWGWFRPYGDRSFAPQSSDVRNEVAVSANGNGEVYYKVALSIEFMEREGIVPIVIVDVKDPIWEAGCAPYGTEEQFFEEIAKFSTHSPIGRAIGSIVKARQGGSRINEAFDLLSRSLEVPSLDERAKLVSHARARLQDIVLTPGSEKHIVDTIAAALPPVLATPKPSDSEVNMSPQAVWHSRLLYALVIGLHKNKLEI